MDLGRRVGLPQTHMSGIESGKIVPRFYIPNDTLALSFGDSRSLDQITLDQMRRFTDTAGLPMRPVWDTVRETVERTTGAWKTLAHKDVLPKEMRDAIDRQIGAARLIF